MSDRERWNAKYRAGSHADREPTGEVVRHRSQLVPPYHRATALDVAGGVGRHALWLAQLGWHVTLCDVSDLALEIARSRAAELELPLDCVRRDVLADGLPPSFYELIVCTHFLDRSLYRSFADSLNENGLLLIVQPTVTNLQRHPRPPAEYLLEPLELPHLVGPLEILDYQEGWSSDNRHEATLLAKRIADCGSSRNDKPPDRETDQDGNDDPA